VIATLWSVNNQSTGIFMQYFYHLRVDEKLSKGEALRQAQMAFIKAGDEENPADLPILTSTYWHPYY
jgi:CHAT domain-containing protein